MFDGRAICDTLDALAPIDIGDPGCGALGWVVLAVVPRCQNLVHRLMDHHNIDVMKFTYEQLRPRKEPTKLPYFPGYVFPNITSDDQWRSITRWPGVIKFLGDDDRPTALTALEVATLTEACPAVLDPVADHPPRRGDHLRILIGAYQGMTGRCVRAHRRRVWIEVQLFGRFTVAELPRGHVEVV